MNRIHSNSDSAAGVTALTHHHLQCQLRFLGFAGKAPASCEFYFWRWQRHVSAIREN